MTNVLTEIFQVFSSVGAWILSAITELTPIFYANGELTFIGVLSVVGLAFSVVFLILGLIQNFLHFRG